MAHLCKVYRIYDIEQFCAHALGHTGPQDASANDYLVVSFSSIPAIFSMTSSGLEAQQRSYVLAQSQMLHLAKRWGLPLSRCWVEEKIRLSTRAWSKRLGKPVVLVELDQHPSRWASAWRKGRCLLKRAGQRLFPWASAPYRHVSKPEANHAKPKKPPDKARASL